MKNQAITDGESPFHYLPDVLTIHSYSGKLPPEMGFHTDTNSGKIETEWFTRLKEIVDIADEYDWIPNVGTTEYGFSPSYDQNNHWAPDYGASQTSQAVYYLRSSLMNATMKPYTGQGWHYSSYFTHHSGVYTGAGYQDFGFRGLINQNPDAQRSIWFMSKLLNDPNATQKLQLFDTNNRVWLPLEKDPNGPNKDFPNREGYYWCGWETPAGQKWGAIWRYKSDVTYLTFSGQSKDFIAPDTFSSLTVNSLHRFTLSSGSANLNTVSGTVTKTVSGGKVRFSIPNVTENPIFIKFN